MTTGLQAPRRSSPPSVPGHATAVVLSAVAGAPQRLLLVLVCFCYVTAGAYVSGFFRPVVVVPATVVLVGLTWRWFPASGPRDARSAVGAVLSTGLAGAWFLLNLPYIAERVQVTRDPDIYTLVAFGLMQNPSPSTPMPYGGSGSLGFYLVDGALRPQGNHLVSAVSASVGWLFGREAVFWGNLACGAVALVALYVVGRRLVGPVWALVPMLALAGSLPMLEFSRAMYSEPLAMTFLFLGTGLLWDAWRSDRLGEYALAGAVFGAMALARIDGTLPLLGVLGGLTLAALVHPDRERSLRRWAAPAVLLGSLPGVLLGFADIYFHSGGYIADHRMQLLMLTAGLLVAALIAFAGALVREPAHRLPVIRRVVSRTAIAGAAVLAVWFAVLLTRPWWYVSRGEEENPLIAAIQAREGSPIDGTRIYAEDAPLWITWYHGWPVLLVGLVGILAWLVLGVRSDSTRLLWLSALFLPSAALYLTLPSITPDQIWAMRRFLPVVVPGLLLATVWVARALATRSRMGGIAAAVLVLSAVGTPLAAALPMWSAKNKAGALEGNRQVCEQIDDRPTIVTGRDTYLPTVLLLCDVPAMSVPRPTPARLAAAREALGDRSVVLATRDPGRVPWASGQPPPPTTYEQLVWEASLTGPPDQVLTEEIGVTLGLVQPDGSVTPLTAGR